MNLDLPYSSNAGKTDDGSAGAFKNFTHIMGMVDSQQLLQVRRITVHEHLFKGKSVSSFTTMSWELVGNKLSGLQEIIFVCKTEENTVFVGEKEEPSHAGDLR
jgi:hypothetical protein